MNNESKTMNNESKSELTELELLTQMNNNLKKLIESNENMHNSILKRLIKNNQDMCDSIHDMTNNIVMTVRSY